MTHKKRKLPRKAAMVITALTLFLCCTIGGTLAWLVTSTGLLKNTFVPAQVQCEVVETFDHTTKSNVYVSNPGSAENVTAYIRVALIPTWEDGEGNVVAQPASLENLNIDLNLLDWLKIGSYYYCKTAIAPGENTPELIKTATVKTANDYRMNLHVLAEAVQAEGKDSEGSSPVELTWGVTLDSSGTIIGQGGSAP